MKENFPSDFLWGAATSAHQVEGNNCKNDWWAWEKRGKVKERSGLACDHWKRYPEDFALARSLAHNAHRFSIEWSRLEPAEGVFDEEAFKHYDAVIESLRQNHLEPILTLHHFTLPLWLAQEGGWLSPRAPRLFERLARIAAERWKDKIHYWMTINEPEIHVFKSYLAGDWPPGERSYFKMVKAVANLWRGHALAFRAIHQEAGDKVSVGVAKNVGIFAPYQESSFLDRLSARLSGFLSNHYFVRHAVRGKTLDFIGLNYYTRHFVKSFRTVEKEMPKERKNFLGWDVYPRGLYELTKEFSRYHLPILISENGICTNDDTQRIAFIQTHLENLSRAIGEGANIIGYLYWSLLDNFEWADGFAPRFGLVEVDYKTQERRVRPSALHLSKIIRSLPSASNRPSSAAA